MVGAHTYRANAFWRVFCLAVGGAMAAGGLFGAAATYFGHDPTAWGGLTSTGGYAVCLLLAAMGIWVAAGIIRWRVILSDDAIAVVNTFTTRRLARNEIGAKTFARSNGLPLYTLYPNTQTQRPLTVGISFPVDQYFHDWIAAIPEADRDFSRNVARHRPVD